MSSSCCIADVYMASVAASRQQVQPTLCRLSKRPLVQVRISVSRLI